MAESGPVMGAALGSRVFSVCPPPTSFSPSDRNIRGITDSG